MQNWAPGGMKRALRMLDVDLFEFLRFVLTGVVATIGNMGMLVLVRPWLEYQVALLAGIFAGFVISFVMGKFFAFRSSSVRHTAGELVRFGIIYSIGAVLFWGVAVVVGLHIAPLVLNARWSEIAGVLAGASVMAVTSYVGHRKFTYRHLRPH